MMKHLIPVLVLLLVAAGAEAQLPPGDKPDLVVIGIDTLPQLRELMVGKSYGIYVWVENRGSPFEDAFLVKVELGDNQTRIKEINGSIFVNSQAKIPFSDFMPFKKTGTYLIRATADPDNWVQEISESNNAMEISVNVSPGNTEVLTGKAEGPKTGGTPLSKPKADAEAMKTSMLLVILIVAILVTVIIIAIYLVRRRGPVQIAQPLQIAPTNTVAMELNSLRREKEELEEALNIAKVKFYKRQMDESSYKEIVKDYQEKLTRIEARMANIEKRVTRLERVEGRQPDKNLE